MHPFRTSIKSYCAKIQDSFPGYLDGSVSGTTMKAIAAHLDSCPACETEFVSVCAVQQSLAALGPASAPVSLQSAIRRALTAERGRGTHLSAFAKLHHAWTGGLALATLRATGAVAATLTLALGLGWMFAAPISSVQANDDAQANLIAPRFLYAQVAPLPVSSDAPMMVEAKIDTDGKVYDYAVLAGPTTEAARLRVEQNLLTSVFKPATLFGVPVRGHVVLTYTAVSARG